ncbi:MAG: hypothetical protein LAT50_12185, partial [Ectothiorhodospiraceae bacterium]|nr:hypothetical protein [Ectothiorhodospiraceae bacterium]
MSSGRSERRRMRRAMNEANRIAQERLEWQQGQMQQYTDMYGNGEQRIINDAERGGQADYQGVTDRATADIVQAFDRARQDQARRDAAYGIDPSSGRATAADRQMGLQQATATAGVVNHAREAERQRANEEFQQNQNRAMSMGANRFNVASGGVDSAYAGLQAERQNAAQTHGQTAANQGNALGGLVGTGVGVGLGMLAGGPGAAATVAQTTQPTDWQSQYSPAAAPPNRAPVDRPPAPHG